MEWLPVEKQIAAYLLLNPESVDTVEGIAEWWLLRQRIQVVVGEVQTALAELAQRNYVVVTRGPDGRMRFGLNRRLQGEIDAWVRLAEPTRKSGRRGKRSARRPRL